MCYKRKVIVALGRSAYSRLRNRRLNDKALITAHTKRCSSISSFGVLVNEPPLWLQSQKPTEAAERGSMLPVRERRRVCFLLVGRGGPVYEEQPRVALPLLLAGGAERLTNGQTGDDADGCEYGQCWTG